MNRTIRIGWGSRVVGLQQAEYTRKVLAAAGLSSAPAGLAGEEALLQGDIDILVNHMTDVPAPTQEGICITAVSERFDPSECLLIDLNRKEANWLLSLPLNASVGVFSHLQQWQLLDFRPDLDTHLLSIQDLEQELAAGWNALLLPATVLQWRHLDLKGYALQPFNPRECTPPPAQGVIAWQVCTGDIPLRRLLTRIHRSEVSAVTNVERKAWQLLPQDQKHLFGAYCERDVAGNYHAWAVLAPSEDTPVVRARLSSSTQYRLAERLLEALSLR